MKIKIKKKTLDKIKKIVKTAVRAVEILAAIITIVDKIKSG